jgi:hypothetical protein
MKPVFAIIDEKERNDFEKEWGIAYGYVECDLFHDFDDAVIDFEESIDESENSWVIERVDEEGREIVYRR